MDAGQYIGMTMNIWAFKLCNLHWCEHVIKRVNKNIDSSWQ